MAAASKAVVGALFHNGSLPQTGAKRDGTRATSTYQQYYQQLHCIWVYKPTDQACSKATGAPNHTTSQVPDLKKGPLVQELLLTKLHACCCGSHGHLIGHSFAPILVLCNTHQSW